MPVSAWRSKALALLLATSLPAAGQGAWDFSLPDLDGRHFVRLAEQAGPVLVNFWSADCPPCVAELPLLLDFARQQPGWTLLLVATDAPQRARSFLQQRFGALPPNVQVLRGAAQAGALMRELGNRHGGLPFSAAQSRAGRLCHRHGGVVDAQGLAALLGACWAEQGVFGGGNPSATGSVGNFVNENQSH